MIGHTERHEDHGDRIARRMRRAHGRAVVAIGENVVRFAKIHAHVISGTYVRSMHTAPVGYIGAGDEEAAMVSDLPNAGLPEVDYDQDGSAALEAGSWVSYACVEEVGRGHVSITPAVEEVRPISGPIVAQAYKEEGL